MKMAPVICILTLQLVSLFAQASEYRSQLNSISDYYDSIKSHTKFNVEEAEVHIKKSLEIRNAPDSTAEEKIDALIIYASISGKIAQKYFSIVKSARHGRQGFEAVHEALHLDPRNCNANYAYANTLNNIEQLTFSGIVASFLEINLRTESCKLVSDPNFRNCNLETLEKQLEQICK